VGVDVTVGEFRVPGARLYTETRGSGPVLLMIVGGNGDPTSYAGVADRLAAGHTVVCWARRGFVRSPVDAPPPDTEGRITADVADAAALIGAHGPAADVFGSSSGAIVALELVARHPELVRTAVVHEPPTLDLLPDPQEWSDRFAAIAATYAQRGTGPAMAEFAEAVGLGPLAGPRSGGPVPPALAGLLDRMDENRRFWFAHEFRQYPAHHLDLDALAAVADRLVPAVGRASQEDGAMPALPVQALAARLRRPVAVLPGGHVGYADHPAEFAAALEELLPPHRVDGSATGTA
jgi:pimeloyl-ACP methyl ester carboxylesterase